MLVLVFLGIILLSFILLYKSGRVTSAKMELQNGADAAAYSASTLEARALNFCAYSNRAMAANEVGIGQMVGMLSWSDELQSAPEFEEFFAEIPIAGEIIMGFQDALKGLGAPIHDALEAIAPVYIKALSTANEVYSTSQQVYYVATLALAAATIVHSLEDNVPGTDMNGNLIDDLVEPEHKGARLSKFGVMALAGHAPSYLNSFTRRYKPGRKKDLQGMGRLAATIREGRDAFSSGRRCGEHDPNRYKPECENRDWELGLEINLKIIKMKAELDSHGGTELRFKNTTDKQHVIWSAVDSAVLDGEIDFDLWAFKFKIPLPGLPFSAGESQATGGTTFLYPTDMPPTFGEQHMRDDAYGDAADLQHVLAWEVGVQEIEGKQVPDDPYTNLRAYRDVPVKKVEQGEQHNTFMLPFTAPFFFVGVVRDMRELDKNPEFLGSLSMDSGSSYSGKIAAIAKSEVYFSRPHNPEYFRREDGRTENPSLFSPFWQARLVDTTDTDRMLALALQQDIIWNKDFNPPPLPSSKELVKELKKDFNPAPLPHFKELKKIIGKLEKILEKIL